MKPISGIKIRYLDPQTNEWDSLHRLIVDTFAYMSARINPPSSALSLTPQSIQEAAENHVILTASDNRKLIACCFLQTIEDAIYIGKLAVEAEYQGNGIARRFVQAAQKLAIANGLKKLTLQVRVELRENQTVFERLGFNKTGTSQHPGFTYPTSITMTKVIG